MVYICSTFHENFLDDIKVIERTKFSQEQFQRDIISLKNIGGVTGFFFSAHQLMDVYICTKFYENIPDGIQVIQQTRFS